MQLILDDGNDKFSKTSVFNQFKLRSHTEEGRIYSWAYCLSVS
jgi:hypothetical protein